MQTICKKRKTVCVNCIIFINQINVVSYNTKILKLSIIHIEWNLPLSWSTHKGEHILNTMTISIVNKNIWQKMDKTKDIIQEIEEIQLWGLCIS